MGATQRCNSIGALSPDGSDVCLISTRRDFTIGPPRRGERGHILASLSDKSPFTDQISLPPDTAEAMSFLIPTHVVELVAFRAGRINRPRSPNAALGPVRSILKSFPPPSIRSATGVSDAPLWGPSIGAFDMGDPQWGFRMIFG